MTTVVMVEQTRCLFSSGVLPNAELAGSVQLWECIGNDGATTFSY